MKRENKNLNDIFRRPIVKAAEPDVYWTLPNEFIGIELEVEDFVNEHQAAGELAPYWVKKVDMSLRNGFEWVLNGPMSGKALRTAIKTLFNNKYQYKMSPRTSTHVHINMQDGIGIEQLRNMFILTYIIEPSIFRWTQEDRKWCSYCCPLTDMDPKRLIAFLNADGPDFVTAIKGVTHEDKYYGFNLVSFSKHGTVEFRYFPCTKDHDTVIAWTQFVMEIKKTAMLYDTPAQMLAGMKTAAGLVDFLRRHMPKTAAQIEHGLDIQDAVTRAKFLDAVLDVPLSDVFGSKGNKAQAVVTKGLELVYKNVFHYDAVAPKPAAVAPVNEDLELYNYWDIQLQNAQDPGVADMIRVIRNQYARQQ